MRAHIDLSKCRGHGQCASVAPDVFRLGDDDRSHLLRPDSDVATGYRELVEDAIAMCPEAAISWEPDEA